MIWPSTPADDANAVSDPVVDVAPVIAATVPSPAEARSAVESGDSVASTPEVPARADLDPPSSVAPAEPRPQDQSAVLAPSLGGYDRIEDIDLSKVPVLADFALASGGLVDLKEARFVDLTNDGRNEALVAVTSQGTYGNLGYFVVGLAEGWPVTLFQVTPSGPNGIHVDLNGDHIVVTEGIYGPEDAMCCPGAIRNTTYAWDGRAFQVDSVEVVDAGQKPGNR
jgi:hypothetical protein